MNEYKLKNKWILWYHSLKDNNWLISSYDNLLQMNDLYDNQLLEDSFQQNHYQNGMFFLMKNNIKPIWEDPKNRMGGCLSFKISQKNILNTWNFLIKKCICENIFMNHYNINGISISPKKEFNIIKIWFMDDINKKSPNYKVDFILNPYLDIHKSIYKKHIE